MRLEPPQSLLGMEFCHHLPKSVLVVENNPDVRTVLVAILKELGHRVTDSASPVEALEGIQRKHFDFMFSGFSLPRMSGIEMARIARLHHPEMKIILVAGAQVSLDSYTDSPSPVDFILWKPFSIADIEAALVGSREV